ncbi:hypothetical protein [Corynebacterium caspium]|uniref:hypothetical protein n=1 Tax=Corynebacterium caspium TaxID=234828 RepID=UPI00036861DA|nr:hypothetical protein [Corynebacterium caspium]WKD59120.1 hypothetical protein CCASP_03580 [Corynebacterium caspium DSM 44850]
MQYPLHPIWRFLTLGALAISMFLLVVILKLPGLLISLVLGLLAFSVARNQPVETYETTTLATSIRLSAEEIEGVLNEFEYFLFSSDAPALADRTLHRPALADSDSTIPEVERFYFEARAAQRFLNRLESRIERCRYSVSQLEKLLAVTDERANSLQESWLSARRASRMIDP